MAKPLKFADFRCAGTCRLYFLGLALTLIVSAAGSALGQQTLELPVPHSQSTQRFHPSANPTAAPAAPRSNRVQTIPSAPPAPEPAQVAPEVEPPPQPPPTPPPVAPEVEQPPPPPPPPPVVQQPAPVLPPVFRGCWRGRVEEVDRIQRLPGAAPTGLWIPKTYLLCYRRVGNGPFKLTFTEAGAEGTHITNTSGRVSVVSTDGRSYASLRAILHFDEFRRHPRPFSNPTFAVDEVTDLRCDIHPDGMHASGVVYGEHDGAPWFRAWWNTTFFHESNLPE